MIGRSLVAKVYAWGVAVFLLGGVVAGVSAYVLLQQGELDALRRFGAAHARFIAREVDRTLGPQGPQLRRLAELGPPMHAELAFIPWAKTRWYPPEMARQKFHFAPQLLPGPSWRTYWIRLDYHGRPVGVLRVAFLPPVNRHLAPLLGALAWMGALGLLLVPPLVVWVIRPLRRMVGVAHRLGAGDLATPVPVTRRDELGELEAAFEGLRVRLARMIGQKEALLRDVSHELRGPLSRMAIALPLLRASHDSPYVAKLEREVQVMDGLIGEILALSRASADEPLKREPVDLAGLAMTLVAERELVARERGLTLTVDLAPAAVNGDAHLLARALSNLLDNALKYVPAGGTVRVRTATAGGEARFEVADDGPGIDAEALAHVFEPFWRPDDSRSRQTGGTGLGLAIVKAIAERHGGAATLASADGQGTTATLALPLA